MIQLPCTLVPLSLILALSSAVAGCGSPPPPEMGDASVTRLLRADLSRPAARHVLPLALTEVSGITALDVHHVAAVQDELGILFVIDLRTGAVVRRHEVLGPGDYEGLAGQGDTLHVLRSDGQLFSVAGWQWPDPVVHERTVPIPGGCNAEGLSLHGTRLLIACKNATTDMPGHRVVYIFEPSNHTAAPAFTLDSASMTAANRDQRRSVERLRYLLGARNDGFRPSAVAIDPTGGDVWVLSAEPPALAVLTGHGTLRGAWPLPRTHFPKPEALAFLPNGDVVVGSEGVNGGQALLYRFRRTDSSYD